MSKPTIYTGHQPPRHAKPMIPTLEAKRVYDLAFRCTTPGPEIEEGEVRGFWTGEIDTWGKYTICPVDGSPALYLFRHEIVSIAE